MALHRSGSYLFLSFFARFFLSVHCCLSSFCHVLFFFLFSITTYFSSFSFLIPLTLFHFSLISGDIYFSPSIFLHFPPRHFLSVLIFIPFPIVFRSSPLLSSLQLHDPSKFKYLATSYYTVASMVPTVRGGSRVLSVIANPVSTAFPWHILVSLSACVYVLASPFLSLFGGLGVFGMGFSGGRILPPLRSCMRLEIS
ncbi:uncharacterized protein BO80DRAFT_207445 [Aspergillus ibericus CBS 121593]|uniref:Uncharacterized protein n=1 Tax=Aspergillus ibericus CBS 121593 TaxID=1448316 RepID=A0A395HB57_9EURO|nr:hypothetical protein BO80DRAFT_207445 [Aspergillus ibericus CBS 121593]RAL04733.1 hypothetical protein BO80DRAFT_207445 [Aspergillus ibericus CBS 121593]